MDLGWLREIRRDFLVIQAQKYIILSLLLPIFAQNCQFLGANEDKCFMNIAHLYSN